MTKVDLCVVNFNTMDKLKRLCSSLQVGPHMNLYNLLVADNGSTQDNSVIELQRNKPWNINTVVFNENIGYAKACNQLAAMGSSPIIALLNSDVWFDTNDLKRIIDAFDDPTISVLGPKQLDEAGRITHAGIQGDETSATPRGWKISDPNDTRYKELEDMVSVSGSAYFIRRSVWEELTNCPIYKGAYPEAEGAFLPTPHYYEETFCSYHCRAHGFRVFYDGRVTIGHSWHASHDVGSKFDKLWSVSEKMFREMCELHQIPHNIKGRR